MRYWPENQSKLQIPKAKLSPYFMTRTPHFRKGVYAPEESLGRSQWAEGSKIWTFVFLQHACRSPSPWALTLFSVVYAPPQEKGIRKVMDSVFP